MRIIPDLFKELTSAERLFDAWLEFRKGKTNRKDVQEFGRHLEKNIFRLHRESLGKSIMFNNISEIVWFTEKLV